RGRGRCLSCGVVVALSPLRRSGPDSCGRLGGHMGVKVGHRHGWVVGLAGLATFGLLVGAATVGDGRAVPRTIRSGPSVLAAATPVRRAARPTSVPGVTRRATHPRAVSASARPTLSARPSASCRSGHVALTFDDGPDPVSTPRLLVALRRAGL